MTPSMPDPGRLERAAMTDAMTDALEDTRVADAPVDDSSPEPVASAHRGAVRALR